MKAIWGAVVVLLAVACGSEVEAPFTGAELCTRTGGTWTTLDCLGGEDRCQLSVCETAFGPGCDCGPARCFDPVEGCIGEPLEGEALCQATGGSWESDGCNGGSDVCGITECNALNGEGCQCGPGRCFNPAEGCVSDAGEEAEATPGEPECLATGGAWSDGLECAGAEDACALDVCLTSRLGVGCDCGPGRCFTAEGCVSE